MKIHLARLHSVSQLLRQRKMATDVFFRHSSTIKEALVAFLMRHVNFIKRRAEQSQREQLQLWKV